MRVDKPQGFLELEKASQMPADAADWGPFTTGFLKMHPGMVPAIQTAIKSAEWRRSPNPVGSIKTAAYRAATRMGIQTLGPIEDAYSVFQKQAEHLSRGGLPKAVTTDDLAQEAAIMYLYGGARGGKDKSKKDVKRTMTDFIRKEQRNHGTAKTPGEKGDRGTTKTIYRKHVSMGVESGGGRLGRPETSYMSDYLMARLEHCVFDKMPKDQKWALRCKLEDIPQKSAAIVLKPHFNGELPTQSQVSRLTKKAVATAEELATEMFGTAQISTGGNHVQEVYREDRGGSEPARGFTIDGEPIRPLMVDPYNKDSQVKRLSATRTLRPVGESAPETIREKEKRDEFGGTPFFSDAPKARKERHDKWLAEHAAIWEPIRQRRRKLFAGDPPTMENDAVA